MARGPTMRALFLFAVIGLAFAGYLAGQRRALASTADKSVELHSRPAYYGVYVALWCGLPALLLTLVWWFAEPKIAATWVETALPESIQALPPEHLNRFLQDAEQLSRGAAITGEVTPELEEAATQYRELRNVSTAGLVVLGLSVAVLGLGWAQRRVSPSLRARDVVERFILAGLIACSTVAILTTVGIVLSLIFEALRFFSLVSPLDFLFGTHWSPQTALRADQVGSSGSFGAIPVFTGTLLITAIAMTVAVPVGLMSAIYLSDYARASVRAWVKPALEVLAGVPTVVYGFFAALMVAPLIRNTGERFGLSVASESALAAGLIMGVMIIPFVSSLSDDVISAVPQSLREGALGLGSTKSEMIRRVILPAALPGIVGAVLLAVSRAIGETMIVVMAAGLAANLTANPFEAVTTVTVQIVTLLVGDQEFDSAKTLAAFALGLILFAVTLVLNVIALQVVRRYREQYE